jgi:hypothetical protein
MGGRCLEGCLRFVSHTELEGGRKGQIRLGEGDRGGHGHKKNRKI